jgi:hypothetical protein
VDGVVVDLAQREQVAEVGVAAAVPGVDVVDAAGVEADGAVGVGLRRGLADLQVGDGHGHVVDRREVNRCSLRSL